MINCKEKDFLPEYSIEEYVHAGTYTIIAGEGGLGEPYKLTVYTADSMNEAIEFAKKKIKEIENYHQTNYVSIYDTDGEEYDCWYSEKDLKGGERK